jgi:hypothetical protein
MRSATRRREAILNRRKDSQGKGTLEGKGKKVKRIWYKDLSKKGE